MAESSSDCLRSITDGCDFLDELTCICDLCEQEGEQVQAVGFCSDCKDYLCQECYDTHTRPRPMRHHVLLDRLLMPKDQQQDRDRDTCTEACTSHPHKTLEYFCTDHGVFGCSACMTLHHRKCGGVDHIPDIAGDILDNVEYTDLQQRITFLTQLTTTAIKTSHDQVKRSQSYHTKALESFQTFKKDMRKSIQRMGKAFNAAADRIKGEDGKKAQMVVDRYKQALKGIQAIGSKFVSLQTSGQFCQLFIAMKRAKGEIDAIESQVRGQGQDTEVRNYKLVPSRDAQKLLDSPETMVTLDIVTAADSDPQPTSPPARPPKQNDPPPCGPKMISVNPGPVLPPKSLPLQPERQPERPPKTIQSKRADQPPERPAKSSPGAISPTSAPMRPPKKTSPFDEENPCLTVSDKPTKQVGAEPAQRVLSASLYQTLSSRPKVTDPISNVKAPASRVPLQRGGCVRKTRALHVKDVRVKSRDDSDTPVITGCIVVPGNKLVLVDSNNGKVKMADLIRGYVVARLELSREIWDITLVVSTQVAVTSPGEEKIYFVNVGDKLELDTEVKVKCPCRGIARINDNLVVSYDEPVKVDIINMEGKVLQTVVREDKGKQLFTCPWYIAVSKDQQTIYISDWNRHTVTSIDLAGRVKATYNYWRKMKWPRGLALDTTGTVYVCGRLSYNVLQLTADLTEERQLLQRSDGVRWPASVYYCEATDRLYVGMLSDVVKVFQLE